MRPAAGGALKGAQEPAAVLRGNNDTKQFAVEIENLQSRITAIHYEHFAIRQRYPGRDSELPRRRAAAAEAQLQLTRCGVVTPDEVGTTVEHVDMGLQGIFVYGEECGEYEFTVTRPE